MVDVFVAIEPSAWIAGDHDIRFVLADETRQVFAKSESGDQLAIGVTEKDRLLDPQHFIGGQLFVLAQMRKFGLVVRIVLDAIRA